MKALAWYDWYGKGNQTYHDYTNAPSSGSINVILDVNTPRYRCGAVVVQVVMQLAISCSEFERFQEQWVVQKGQGIEDVEIELRMLLVWPQARDSTRSIPSSQESGRPSSA